MTPASAIEEGGIEGPRAAAVTSTAFRKEAVLLAVFYTLMHGGILLIPNAVFWDDWVLYRTAPEVISQMFRDAGVMFNAVTYVHFAMLEMGMWSYKAFTFVLWFAAGLALNRILARTTLFPDTPRVAVVLLFLVLPFNAARVAAIDFPYTLCAFLFFLAWMLMDRWRVASLLLFVGSFFTASLLMFYALPIADMAYRGGYLNSLRGIRAFVVRRLDFLLLPLAFFAVRSATFKPAGTYVGYQSNYSWSNVRSARAVQWNDAQLLLMSVDGLLFLALLVPVGLLLARSFGRVKLSEFAPIPRKLLWIAFGLAAFVLGAFPYWVLGLAPVFAEWSSRHQLLLPLGTALVLVGAIWLSPARWRLPFLSVIVALSLSLGIGNYHAFWVDWQKQRALIDLFRRSPDIANASLVVFDDRTRHLDAIGRVYRFYEWNGLMEEAFGTETRFGVNAVDASKYLQGHYDRYMQGQYKAAGHRRDPGGSVVAVKIAEKDPGSTRTLGFGIWRWPPLPAIELEISRLAPGTLPPTGSK